MTEEKLGIAQTEEEIVERSIFGENQYPEMVEWMKDRQNLELRCQITGKWVQTNEFFKGTGRILKRYDGKIFQNEVFILLAEGDLGKEEILIGRRIIKIKQKQNELPLHRIRKLISKKNPQQEILEEPDILDPNVYVIENWFKKDMQNQVFFRAEQDYERAISWLSSFLKKYEVSCHIEGVMVAKDRQIPCILTGTVKSVDSKDIYIQLWDAFSPADPLNDEIKEWLSREWTIQISQTGINKVHPQYLLFEIGEELALTKKVLSVDNVKVVLGGQTIIHDVNFLVEKGEILGIIGESGAGKTTTLKAILGEFEFSGNIHIFGMDAHNTKGVAPFIGYVPQDLSRMYGNFNCLENIIAFGRQYGIPDDILIQRGKKILEDLGIAHVANQNVDSLSGGQKRRASIAISMVHNPYLLFLDEPTSGLDPLARYELWDYLDLINKEYGITLVVISHYLDEIEYCDKSCIFLRGIGFYDFNTPDGLKKSLPGKGLALEVTLEEVSTVAVQVLRSIPGVDFVIQRGERIRVLSTFPSKVIAEKVIRALEQNKFTIHSLEYKVEIDMIDYFTYTSVIHNTQASDGNTGKIDAKQMKLIVKSQSTGETVESAIGMLPTGNIAMKVSVDGEKSTLNLNTLENDTKQAEIEAKRKEEEAAKLKANEEKKQAEIKAKLKAEEAAKLKADEEKKQAEIEAKHKAEEAAKLKADEEKKQAEIDAKHKSEESIKIQVEETKKNEEQSNKVSTQPNFNESNLKKSSKKKKISN